MKNKLKYSISTAYPHLVTEISQDVQSQEEKLNIEDRQVALVAKHITEALNTLARHYNASKEGTMTLIQKVTDPRVDNITFQAIIQRLQEAGKQSNRLGAAQLIIEACTQLRLFALGDERFYTQHTEVFAKLEPYSRQAFIKIVTQAMMKHIQYDLLGKKSLPIGDTPSLKKEEKETESATVLLPSNKASESTKVSFFGEGEKVFSASTVSQETPQERFLAMIEDINESNHNPHVLKGALMRQREALQDFFAGLGRLEAGEQMALINALCSKNKTETPESGL